MLSEQYTVSRFVPGTPPQILVDGPARELADEAIVEPVSTTGESVVCRVRTEKLESCEEPRALASGFDLLPVKPYNIRWKNGTLYLSIAARDDEELQEVVQCLEDIGIEDADHNFYGVTPEAPDAVTAVGSGGTVYDYDGAQWVRTDLGDAQLNAVADRDLVVGDGGVVFRRDATWSQETTPTGTNLQNVLKESVNITVGAGGVVLEKG